MYLRRLPKRYGPLLVAAAVVIGTQARLWNPDTGDLVSEPVAVASGPVTSIAFDPAGDRLVTTGGPGGTVKLWAASTLQQEGSALASEPGASTVGAFEPSGKALLVVDNHGRALTWPMAIAAWQRCACAIAGRDLTRQEWDRYVPQLAYARTCA